MDLTHRRASDSANHRIRKILQNKKHSNITHNAEDPWHSKTGMFILAKIKPIPLVVTSRHSETFIVRVAIRYGSDLTRKAPPKSMHRFKKRFAAYLRVGTRGIRSLPFEFSDGSQSACDTRYHSLHTNPTHCIHKSARDTSVHTYVLQVCAFLL